MRFPSAYHGVKKLFIGELLQILVAALGIAVAVLASVNQQNPNDVIAGVLAGVGIGTLVILLIAAIIQFIGFIQASRDDGNFKVSLWLIILSLILTVTAQILGGLNINATIAISAIEVVTNIANVLVLLYMLYGIVALAAKLGNGLMAGRGRMLVWAVVIMFVFTTAFAILSRYIPSQEVVTTFSIVAAVIETIIYILIVIYLGAATRMLSR